MTKSKNIAGGVAEIGEYSNYISSLTSSPKPL